MEECKSRAMTYNCGNHYFAHVSIADMNVKVGSCWELEAVKLLNERHAVCI